MKPNHSISAHRMRCILELLLEQDLDQKQLAAALFITRPAGIKGYLAHLKRDRKVHIVTWRPRGVNGHTWAVYRLGRGTNAPPPPVKPMSQVHREWRIRSGRQPPDKVASAPVDPFAQLFVR